MSLVSLDQTGFDPVLNVRKYTETRRCKRCARTFCFSYMSSYGYEVLLELARERPTWNRDADVCPACRGIAARGYYQPRLV